MIKLAKITDYGIALMSRLARDETRSRVTARDLSANMDLPLPTVRKLLKLLVHGGLLESHRGIQGGYNLSRDPAQISLVELVDVLEGPVALTECASAKDCACEMQTNCEVRDNWQWINERFTGALAGVSLKEMAGSLAASGREGV